MEEMDYKVIVNFDIKKQAVFQHNLMILINALREYGKKEDQ